jgi:hypothetical protein
MNLLSSMFFYKYNYDFVNLGDVNIKMTTDDDFDIGDLGLTNYKDYLKLKKC